MRILIYSDSQAGEGSERCFHDPTLPLQRYRLSLLYSVLDELFNELKCDALWDGGDNTDDRTSIPIPTLNTVFGGLRPFRKSAQRNRKLIGNHEQWVRSGSIHVGAVFEGIFDVISEPRIEMIEGIKVLFASYPAETFDMEGWLDANLKKGERSLVFGHFQVEGTKDRDGRTLKGGVHVSILKKATMALLGHIHHPQSITDTIHYIGSPFQQDFGESGEEKRVALLDLPSLDLEWVGMAGFPTYQTLPMDQWERAIENDLDSENRYRVVLGSRDDHERYLQHPNMRRAMPVYEGLTSANDIRINAPRVGPVSFDAADVLGRYFKSRPPTDLHGIGSEEFLQFGLDLLAR